MKIFRMNLFRIAPKRHPQIAVNDAEFVLQQKSESPLAVRWHAEENLLERPLPRQLFNIGNEMFHVSVRCLGMSDKSDEA